MCHDGLSQFFCKAAQMSEEVLGISAFTVWDR
jgi:hypothetical protein